MDKVEHLYLHVPFCATKCRYCAFYSEPGQTDKMEAFVAAVLKEMQPWASRLAPKTIFVGGGTPSLLPAPLLRPLLTGWPRNPELIEWTVECNPATVSPEKIAVFQEVGVNRISLGVQALDDELLQMLGRIHTAATAVATYRELRSAGFDNLNLDLMFGLPGQTLEQWRDTLCRAIELQPEHFSTYCLSFEEDTEFWKLFQAGHLRHNSEQELAMYELTIDTLAAAGYRQYEISNPVANAGTTSLAGKAGITSALVRARVRRWATAGGKIFPTSTGMWPVRAHRPLQNSSRRNCAPPSVRHLECG